ncbi:hypothetical protein DAPPUDRAFT_253490 [Daphnia pulex]|uniref:CUB domain-containing protein n=1 Tax=Daphnia pulex TaxID=6669 RepID=E9H4Y6_DAPPU|nr:hypothetical protein DAPPUDRAFT_253490 [Daphnia pulex]|eukprot:EFX73226.1 hypothetical protein DAPPUDRAFT_253490 [Daphnia pulex]
MCANVTSTGNGVVQSPNFPGDYGNKDRFCAVTIVVPAGKGIQLQFTTFNLETDKGDINILNREAAYFYGATGSKAPAVVTTKSNTISLQFTSSSSAKPNASVYNWQATYTAVTV